MCCKINKQDLGNHKYTFPLIHTIYSGYQRNCLSCVRQPEKQNWAAKKIKYYIMFRYSRPEFAALEKAQ